MRILVVEDDDMSRDILCKRFLIKGIEVTAAENGLIALGCVKDCFPDIIIMDMRMPVMDGYEATKILKGDQKTAAIPIIALSAHCSTNDIEKSVNAGCISYLTKPVKFNILLKEIENILGYSIIR